MARNLFHAAKPGAKLSVLYVPGPHPADDVAPVQEVSGIEVPVLSPETLPGTQVHLKYHNMASMGGLTYEIFYWPVEMVVDALTNAGFIDVAVSKLSLDPSYSGAQDLKKFVRHTGNRVVTGTRPGSP